MVEQSTAASHALAGEARDLARLVSRFRIDGGLAPVARSAPPVAAAPPARRPLAAAQGRVVAFAAAQGADVDGWSEF
jgi:methyl-accepting chemotaxis protein